MDATKRPWLIEKTNNPGVVIIVGSETGQRVGELFFEEEAALIVRAVNTFDQAREALKAAEKFLGGGEWSLDPDDQALLEQIQTTLASMEATHE